MILAFDVSVKFTRANESLITGWTVVMECFGMHPDSVTIKVISLVTLVLALEA